MLKNKIHNILFIILPFIIAIPLHFIYTYIPFPLLAIYAPIKESVFEHIKLTFTPIIITYLLLYFLNKKLINKEKYLSSLIISIITSIVSMLVLYYICFSIFQKDIVIVSILTLLIATFIGQILGTYTYKKDVKWSIDISIYTLLTLTLVLLLLTINPPNTDFFIDKSSK